MGAGSIFGGAIAGAGVGLVAGPLGALVGGVVGLAFGAILGPSAPAPAAAPSSAPGVPSGDLLNGPGPEAQVPPSMIDGGGSYPAPPVASSTPTGGPASIPPAYVGSSTTFNAVPALNPYVNPSPVALSPATAGAQAQSLANLGVGLRTGLLPSPALTAPKLQPMPGRFSTLPVPAPRLGAGILASAQAAAQSAPVVPNALRGANFSPGVRMLNVPANPAPRLNLSAGVRMKG
jgi:hypothetical protein